MRLNTRIYFPVILGMLLFLYAVQLIAAALQERPALRTGEARVGLVQSALPSASDLTSTEIEELVNQAILNAGGIRHLIKPGGTVLIKVNLVAILDEQISAELNGITVDWRVARAVVRQALAAGAGEVYIIEGSIMDTPRLFKILGYDRITELPSGHLIALEEDILTDGAIDRGKIHRFKVREGLITRYYDVSRRILEADTLISIASLKTHRRIGLTGAVKSIALGCYPAPLAPNPLLKNYFANDRGWRIDHRPKPLSRWITDYYSLIPADFAIIDGLQGAEYGPLPPANTNYRKNMRLVLAGSDAVAVDTVAALVMARNPASALYLKMLAEEKGLGITDPARIRVVGARVDQVRQPFASDYGEAIPLHRQLSLQITGAKITPKNTTVSFNIKSSDRLSRIDLFVNGKLFQTFAPATRQIVIPKGLAGGSSLVLKVFNIYLDEVQSEVRLTP